MNLSYVLITAARNEAAYIEKTIQSVVGQTMLPQKWVIVSDGSTDDTDEIVHRYAAKHDLIQIERIGSDSSRDFSSKVRAMTIGYRRLSNLEYAFIGILDADVSFEPDYYERVLSRFNQNPNLGIGGGVVFDSHNGVFRRRLASLSHVGGPIQMFRRECYEDIGGFVPISIGGEDAIAEVMARMHGWEVRSSPGIKAYHLRRTGTEGSNVYQARFIQGRRAYLLGFHPIFQMTKCLARVVEKPYVLGSLSRLMGYVWSGLRRENRPCTDEFVKHLRREQLRRLVSFVAVADFVWKPREGSHRDAGSVL